MYEFQRLQNLLEDLLLLLCLLTVRSCFFWGFLITLKASRYEIVDTLLAVQHEYIFILYEVTKKFHRIVANYIHFNFLLYGLGSFKWFANQSTIFSSELSF
jgi:hypothetical protein